MRVKKNGEQSPKLEGHIPRLGAKNMGKVFLAAIFGFNQHFSAFLPIVAPNATAKTLPAAIALMPAREKPSPLCEQTERGK